MSKKETENAIEKTGDKREAETEDFNPSKRAALENDSKEQEYFYARSVIPTKLSGYVIGKAGSIVKSIREETGTRVSLSEVVSGSNERILTISGKWDQVAKAHYLILSKIEEQEKTPPLGQSRDIHSNKLFVKLLVAHTHVGCILGKGGSKIKLLQEETGAHVVLSEDLLPNSTERSTTVTGRADQIYEALKRIFQFLMERPSDRSNSLPYRPMSVPSMAAYSGVPSFSPQVDHYSHPRPRHILSSQTPSLFQPPNVTQQFLVPNDLVGAVIGKGGSRISEIRQMSGSQIHVGEIQPGTNDRIVSVVGTKEGNQTAVYLLYHRLQLERTKMSHKPS